MNITLTLGDFLAIAAIVVIFARGSHAYLGRPSREQLRMQRQLDAIMSHLGLAEPAASGHGMLSNPVAALVKAGRTIEAMKLYRQESGEGLKEAKAAVERVSAGMATAH